MNEIKSEWKFVNGGDGVEYEIWEKDGKEYSVPIEIVRNFDDAILTDKK